MRWRTSLRYQYRDEPLENSDIVDKTVKKGYFVDIVVDTSIGMDIGQNVGFVGDTHIRMDLPVC